MVTEIFLISCCEFLTTHHVCSPENLLIKGVLFLCDTGVPEFGHFLYLGGEIKENYVIMVLKWRFS